MEITKRTNSFLEIQGGQDNSRAFISLHIIEDLDKTIPTIEKIKLLYLFLTIKNGKHK